MDKVFECVNCHERFVSTGFSEGSAAGMSAYYETSEKECSVPDGGGNTQTCMSEPW